MKQILAIALIVAAAALSGGCRNQNNETSDTTGTISPASPPQGESTTDAVTTQTVDLGDMDRSPNEGAGQTAEPTTGTPTTTAPRKTNP